MLPDLICNVRQVTHHRSISLGIRKLYLSQLTDGADDEFCQLGFT